MYRNDTARSRSGNDTFGKDSVLLSLLLCVVCNMAAYAADPILHSEAADKTSVARTNAAGEQIDTIRWTFCCLDRTWVEPFENPQTKAVVLVFISPDCPIANAYHPQLKQLSERFHGRGVRFFLIHSNVGVSAAVARTHAEAFGLSLPVVLDDDQSIARAAKAKVTPEAMVFAPGRPLPIYRGAIDDRYAGYGKKRRVAKQFFLQDALNAYLKGDSIAVPKTTPVGCFISFDDHKSKRRTRKPASR